MTDVLLVNETESVTKNELSDQVKNNARKIYLDERRHYHARIDKLFLMLFVVQWPVAVLMALYMTPTTWAGSAAPLICMCIWLLVWVQWQLSSLHD